MTRTLLGAIAAAALPQRPRGALADGSPADPGTSTPSTSRERATTQAEPPGPDATPAAKARAYGRYCKDESRKHIAGQKGTPFSQCVTAMARLASGTTTSPARACKELSRSGPLARRGRPTASASLPPRLERDQ